MKISYYNYLLSSLRQCNGSLAKPIFLISVFDAIDNRLIVTNKIHYTDWLNKIYLHNYGLFSDEEVPPIKYPYYYLRNDGFYYLEHTIDEKDFPKTPSLKFLNENIPYAYFDEDLWLLLQDASSRDGFRNTLIKCYLHKNEKL